MAPGLQNALGPSKSSHRAGSEGHLGVQARADSASGVLPQPPFRLQVVSKSKVVD